MKDNDLKRNASGYYDEPCYKACTALPKPGEIWQHSRSGDYILILAVNDRVCSILKLTDRECTDGIQIVCKVPMFTSPAMVAYVFNESIGDYVKSLKEEEFREIQKAVGKALGITATAAVPHDHINALEEKVRQLTKENEKLLMDHNMAVDIANDLHVESIELSREIDDLKIYKELYMDIINKLVAAKVGAGND